MGATPKNPMRCGCGMLGEGTEHEHRNTKRFSERKFTVTSHENGNSHTMTTWWCPEDRQSEWFCTDKERGRFCEAGLSMRMQ